MNSHTVHFVASDVRSRWPDLHELTDPAEVADRMRSGVDVWVVSTYLYLKQVEARLPFRVAISHRFVPGTATVAHRDDVRIGRGYSNIYLAAVRADRPPIVVADWQIVQNPLQERSRAVFIPSWPQPGLIPRSPGRRGVEALGYFGRGSSLPDFFRSPSFLQALDRRGIRFVHEESSWRDYSAVDVSVGIRHEPEVGLATKPFAKLTNSWLAGVPALLGPEPAYRAIRRSELDYIEVLGPEDVLSALDRLRQSPELHTAMVENGRARSVDYDIPAVRARWIRFLEDDLLAEHARLPRSVLHRVSRRMLAGLRLAHQRFETSRYKRLERRSDPVASTGTDDSGPAKP